MKYHDPTTLEEKNLCPEGATYYTSQLERLFNEVEDALYNFFDENPELGLDEIALIAYRLVGKIHEWIGQYMEKRRQ